MIYVNKNVVCPKCGSVITCKQVEKTDNTNAIEEENIISDMICKKCREKIEKDIREKSNKG